MNECLNIDSNFCYIFVFENGICYLGRKDFSNGTVAEIYPSVTVNTVISKWYENCIRWFEAEYKTFYNIFGCFVSYKTQFQKELFYFVTDYLQS